MVRLMVSCGLFLGLLIGCGESYGPAERADDTEPAAEGGTPAVGGERAEPDAAGENGEVRAGAIRLNAPDSWLRQPPRSGFIAAEFQLPRAEGDSADGRLTVSVAGGSVAANIDRWRGQFGDKPEKASQDEVPIAGVTVTVVDFSGTFNDQMGPFAPATVREGYRMMGAVVPAGNQLHFIKAYGPEKTVEKHAESFRGFLQTLQVD